MINIDSSVATVEVTEEPTSVSVQTLENDVSVVNELTTLEVENSEQVLEVVVSQADVTVGISQTDLEVVTYNNTLEVTPSIVEIISVGIQGPEGSPGVNAESLQLEANEPIGGHRAVVIQGSGVSYANNDELSDLGKVLGVSKNAATAGGLVEVVFAGVIEESSWNFNIGPVFVGQDGLLTQSSPNTGFSQQIGIALATTKLLVHPKITFKLL